MAAAILFLLTGVAELVSVPADVAFIARNRAHPLVPPGVHALAGPFDGFGIDAVVALGWLFVAFGAAELAVAVLLWRSRRAGGVLAAVLFLPGLFFWIGFALPFWLFAGTVRIALVARAWNTLR